MSNRIQRPHCDACDGTGAVTKVVDEGYETFYSAPRADLKRYVGESDELAAEECPFCEEEDDGA